jgi:hypothetical protein
MIGAQGARDAGAAAGAAGDRAFQNAQTEGARNRAITAPWYNVGSEAINKLAQAYGLGHLDNGQTDPTFGGRALVTSGQAGDRTNALRDFQASPGFQFRLGEGVNALDRSAASRGMVLSGAQTRAVQDYGQNRASDEWGNYISGLSALSGGGQATALGTNSTNAGIFNGGNALGMEGAMGRASSYSNAANALASGISRGVSNTGAIIGATNPFGIIANNPFSRQ